MITRRELVLMAAGGAAAAEPARSATTTALRVNGKDVASLYYGAEWDKPFLYPIRTVSGKVLSRGYPVEKIAGEQATDHVWHRGIWYGHGVVNGHDFWREQEPGGGAGANKTKTSKLVAKSPARAHKIKGRPAVSVTTDLMTPDAKSLGIVALEFAAEDKGSLRFIDAAVTIHANQGVPLTFGDTDDGGFAFRLNDAFRQDRGARLRNSSGLERTEQIWGKPAHWVDYSAMIDGTPAGVAVFDHPSNLRHPTAWHARGYSLCSANPFAAKSFSKGKAADGSYTLPAGERLRLQYRVVIHEGPCEPAAIEELYRAWTATSPKSK